MFIYNNNFKVKSDSEKKFLAFYKFWIFSKKELEGGYEFFKIVNASVAIISLNNFHPFSKSTILKICYDEL